jgi:hypothetical protein
MCAMYLRRTTKKERRRRLLLLAFSRFVSHGAGPAAAGCCHKRKLIEELRELKSLDVLLATREKNRRLRVVAIPPKELKVLLQKMKILFPQ